MQMIYDLGRSGFVAKVYFSLLKFTKVVAKVYQSINDSVLLAAVDYYAKIVVFCCVRCGVLLSLGGDIEYSFATLIIPCENLPPGGGGALRLIVPGS
jgi:hypothetical protein